MAQQLQKYCSSRAPEFSSQHHVVLLTTTSDSSLIQSNTLFWLPWAPIIHVTHGWGRGESMHT